MGEMGIGLLMIGGFILMACAFAGLYYVTGKVFISITSFVYAMINFHKTKKIQDDYAFWEDYFNKKIQK